MLCEPVDPILRDYLPIPEDTGLAVVRVVPGSPAERAGLRERDILVAVAGGPPIPLPDLERLRSLVQTAGSEGKPLRLIRLREGKKEVVAVMPEKPGEAEQAENTELAEPHRRGDRGGPGLDREIRELLEPLTRQMEELDAMARKDSRAVRDRLERETNGLDRRFKELRQQQRRQFRELNQRIEAQNQALERMAKQLRRLAADRDKPRDAADDHGDHE